MKVVRLPYPYNTRVIVLLLLGIAHQTRTIAVSMMAANLAHSGLI